MDAEDKVALDKLVASGIRIPPQPRVLLELRELIVKGDYDIRDVGVIIAKDPGIVAMLFKAARSPAFSRGRKFKSLDQVLMVLGVQQTCNLVQAMSLSSTLSDATRGAFETFWMRANDIAMMASIIAEDQVSVCNVFPDQAYLAGIFFECGVPVLMMRFKDYCKTLHLDDARCWPNLSDEDAKFNVDHCSIGYLVAKHWNLPDFVCTAIRFHHEMPSESSMGAAISLIAILQLAINFYHRFHQQHNPIWDRIGQRVVDEIGLSHMNLDDYYESVIARFLNEDV